MNTTQHLSDEQFAELLSAPAAATGNLHLQACNQCRAEFTAIGGSVADLRTALTNLAASTPLATFDRQPVVLLHSTSRFAWLKRQGLAAGFAAVLVIAGGSIAMLHPAHPVVVPVAAHPSDALSDDALLEDINQDLATSVAPSLAPLSVTETAAARTQR